MRPGLGISRAARFRGVWATLDAKDDPRAPNPRKGAVSEIGSVRRRGSSVADPLDRRDFPFFGVYLSRPSGSCESVRSGKLRGVLLAIRP